MTIHHDKFAYGKLKSCDEQLSQDSLSKIIRQMNASADESVETDSAPAEPAAAPAPEDESSPADPTDK